MIFLIEYDRGEGVIKSFRSFCDSEMPKAREAQFELELKLKRAGTDREVVLLQAENESTIRRTHRRYFEDLASLLKPIVEP